MAAKSDLMKTYILEAIRRHKPVKDTEDVMHLKHMWKIPDMPYIDVDISLFSTQLGPIHFTSIYTDLELVWFEKETLRAIYSTNLETPIHKRRWICFSEKRLRPFESEERAIEYCTKESDYKQRKQILGEELWFKLNSGEVAIKRCSEWGRLKQYDATRFPIHRCENPLPEYDFTIRTMLIIEKQPNLVKPITEHSCMPEAILEKKAKVSKKLTEFIDIDLSHQTYQYLCDSKIEKIDDSIVVKRAKRFKKVERTDDSFVARQFFLFWGFHSEINAIMPYYRATDYNEFCIKKTKERGSESGESNEDLINCV